MQKLINEIRCCTICKSFLPNEPRPILQASADSKIIIIGQAPGQKVQNSGIPWDDASGNELRRWLDVSKEQFYNDKIFALVPMGFVILVRESQVICHKDKNAHRYNMTQYKRI